MKDSTSDSTSYSKNGRTSRSEFNAVEAQEMDNMQSSHLMKLFQEELKDIYWAEKALTKAIPKMIKNAAAEELTEALENHLRETEEQIKRLEGIFEAVDKRTNAKRYEGMEGLIKETEEIIEEDAGLMWDAGIISAAQSVQHYDIASYGKLRQFARTLEL